MLSTTSIDVNTLFSIKILYIVLSFRLLGKRRDHNKDNISRWSVITYFAQNLVILSQFVIKIVASYVTYERVSLVIYHKHLLWENIGHHIWFITSIFGIFNRCSNVFNLPFADTEQSATGSCWYRIKGLTPQLETLLT